MKKMFDETSSLWRLNLVSWIFDAYLERIVSPTIDNSKLDPDIHEQRLEERSIKYARSNDFRQLIGQIPKEYMIFNEASKIAVNEFAERWLQYDFHEWSKYLWVLAKAIRDLQNTETQSTEEKVLKENLDYLKQLFFQRFPEKAIELEQRLAHRAKTETESPRPNCIECGSNHVTSNGPLWYCQDCGRKWTKNPRHKQKL